MLWCADEQKLRPLFDFNVFKTVSYHHLLKIELSPGWDQAGKWRVLGLNLRDKTWKVFW